jgi:hypothetical protein
MRYGQDYLTDTPETFASSLKARWQQQPTATIVAEALKMLNAIYTYLSGFVVSQIAPKPTIENAAGIVQQVQAVSSIADTMRALDSPEQYSAADAVAYKRIVRIIELVSDWWSTDLSALKQYVSRCEMGTISIFSDQVITEAIKIGNLENAHILPAVKQYLLKAAYSPQHPGYVTFAAIREKYNSDGTPKPGVAIADIPMTVRIDQIKQDYYTAVKDTQAGKNVDIAKIATQTGAPASGSKITLIAVAAIAAGLLLSK